MKVTEFEYDRFEKLQGYKRKWKLSDNEYRVEGDTVYVKLSGKESNPVMICDADDWERLKEYPWHCSKSGGYAVTNVSVGDKHTVVKFHQLIMGQRKGFLIDHINRNPLDNRKENLRFVTPTANLINKGLTVRNKSGIKGVSWRNDSNKWRAQITLNGKIYCLGSYESKEDAIKARKAAEEKYFKPLLETS